MDKIVELKTYIDSIDKEEYTKKILFLLKDSKLNEVKNYLNILPSYSDQSFGLNYRNTFYNLTYLLENDKDKTTDMYKKKKINDLEKILYNIYINVNYKDINFSFKEFITFSMIFNETFEKLDLLNDDNINDIVNEILNNNINSSEYIFEIEQHRLDNLRDVLKLKLKELKRESVKELYNNKLELFSFLDKNDTSDVIKRETKLLIKKYH